MKNEDMSKYIPVSFTKLRVVEVFQSIQGEGLYQGKQVVFIRLAGCNLRCSFCDTDHSTGVYMTINELMEEVVYKSLVNQKTGRISVVWTGGEPCLQLTSFHVLFFASLGWWQAIETNGTLVIPDGLNHISISPKENLYVDCLKQVHSSPSIELRFPVTANEEVMDIIRFIFTQEYACFRQGFSDLNIYVSPVFTTEARLGEEHLSKCLQILSKRPDILLSLQIHKLVNLP